mgnify:CR=1 FL=1
MEMMGQALVIDDHNLFAAGMTSLIGNLPEIAAAAHFPNPEAAIAGAGTEPVVLVIADFYIPGFPAETWLPRLREHFAEATMVVVSSSLSRADREQSEAFGAAAFFEKHARPEWVLESLTALMAGGDVVPAARDDLAGTLSPRQIEILTELCRGGSQKEIAVSLGVSPETVKSHISRIYRELAVDGRQGAVDWAHRNGIA